MAISDISVTARPRTPPGKRPFIVIGAALGVLLLIAAALAWRVVVEERARDLENWQIRLGIVADGRLAAITDWLDRQMGEVSALAGNPSIQLYLSELGAAGGDPSQIVDDGAQQSYLRNLLIATAQRSGFVAASPGPGPVVNANLRRPGFAGLLVLDVKKQPVAGTPEAPPLDGRLAEWVAGAAADKRAILDIFPGAESVPTMAFLAPILDVEAGGTPGQGARGRPVGYVVGVKPVVGELFPLLRPPGPPEPGARSMLVRPDGAAIEFITPTGDGAAPRRLAKDTPELAAAFAMAAPGGFAIRRDESGKLALVTGRAVPGTPWTLVHEVERGVALGESDRRGTRLAIAFGLALAVIGGGLVVVWREASSRRATAAAAAFETMAKRFENQSELLRLVTDSQPNAIFIADEHGRYRFANLETERRTGLAEPDLIGKTLDAVLGPAVAARYLTRNAHALATRQRVNAIDHVGEGGEMRVLQTAHVPLAPAPDRPPSVLVVEEDLTALVGERERRERILRQLVRAMTAAVDRRDHFAADQSVQVAALARAIAEEMGLDPTIAETAEIAGNLVNFGKLLVPSELLTKAHPLSETEIHLIRSSINATADFLAGIEFDGPVIETLRLMPERWDGGGPQGVKGEAIPMGSRIVAVANAFVAIASPRAWRPSSDVDTALNQLMERIGTQFDRRVVVALVSYLDNRGGRARWLALVEGAAAPSAVA